MTKTTKIYNNLLLQYRGLGDFTHLQICMKMSTEHQSVCFPNLPVPLS